MNRHRKCKNIGVGVEETAAQVESKKQDNFMQMMLNQQQQQQRQMQDFQALMSIQTKQQNDLMLALVSKLVEKK